MKIKDISLEKPLEKVENHEIPEIADSTSVQEIGKEKIDSLKKAIREIEVLIESREKLSKDIFDKAQKEKIDISNFFVENPTGEQEVREKIALKQKQVELSELQLNERISCWKDIALLKKELREREQELNEKQGRINMLHGILEE